MRATPAASIGRRCPPAVRDAVKDIGHASGFSYARRRSRSASKLVEAAEYSASLTAVLAPDADRLRATILERFDMSLGGGLGKLRDKVFRIGHLGSLNDLMLAGALSGVEMGLALSGTPHRAGGVQAALDVLRAQDAQDWEPVPSGR